jgi:hypothetical protein
MGTQNPPDFFQRDAAKVKLRGLYSKGMPPSYSEYSTIAVMFPVFHLLKIRIYVDDVEPEVCEFINEDIYFCEF